MKLFNKVRVYNAVTGRARHYRIWDRKALAIAGAFAVATLVQVISAAIIY